MKKVIFALVFLFTMTFLFAFNGTNDQSELASTDLIQPTGATSEISYEVDEDGWCWWRECYQGSNGQIHCGDWTYGWCESIIVT